jgi:hypothetical protein
VAILVNDDPDEGAPVRPVQIRLRRAGYVVYTLTASLSRAFQN